MHLKGNESNRIAHIISFILVVSYGPAVLAYDPVDCVNEVVKVDSEIPVGLVTRLCSGAWTAEPVKCYLAASKIDAGIVRGIAIELCAGTLSARNTLECYVKAGTTLKLNRGLATTLCSARKIE